MLFLCSLCYEGGKLLLQHAQRLINYLERSQYEIVHFKLSDLIGSLKIGSTVRP